MNVLFRFDCGPSIGMGHAVRSLAVAGVLTGAGVHCTAAYGSSSKNHLPRHLLREVSTFEIPDDKELYEVLPLLEAPRSTVLVIDHYGAARDNLSADIFMGTRKVLIDDLETHTNLPCDILINPNIDSGLVLSYSYQCLLGPKYAPIHDEIRQLSGQWHPARKQSRRDQCLISIGSTDPLNLTHSILKTIAHCPERKDFGFVVVLSSSAPYLYAVKALCATLASELIVELIEDANNMGALYRDAHCCIGAAGSSAWERCCVGLPTAQLVVADNQRHIQDNLLSAGAVFDLPNPDDARFSNTLRSFLRSANARDQSFLALSKCGKALVDGQGAERIAQTFLRGLT
jgi:UDP-2,4-diacetamido-2,4,6-trideoxy-beta-L-altropyranose hydrolase